MLELRGLRFKAIGRFIEEQYIDFTVLSNFIQVDGQNNNTGGSSGAAKSTIFNALDYLLGINDLPTTVLQSRLTKEHMSVTGYFDWDGKSLEILRSKSGLKIDIDGKITEGSSLVAEEKLDQILGMSRDLFRKTLHKRQKEGGFFLDFTPKKMHEFLADCLNLGEFRKKSEIIDKKFIDLTKSKIKAESDLASTKAGRIATQDAMLSLGPAPIKDIQKEVICELKEKMDRSELRFKDVQSRHEKMEQLLFQERPSIAFVQPDISIRESLERRREEIETAINQTRQEDQDKQSEIKKKIFEQCSERSRIIDQIDSGKRNKDEIAKIANEIKQIRASKCPTCEQHWATESAKNIEAAKIADLIRLKEIIVIATIAEQKKIDLDSSIALMENALQPTVNTKLAVLNEQLSSVMALISDEKRKSSEIYDKQNTINKKLMDDFTLKQSDLKVRNRAEIDQVRGQLDIDRRTFDIAVNRLRAYEDARQRYESSLSSLKFKEENFTKQIFDQEKAIINIENELLLIEEVRKAIKIYISYSFDDALEIIGNSATKIIRCIPNMSNATIQFEGTKETKDGRTKEEVSAVIGMDGEIGIPIKSLSGGERSAVDLAVDLAVIDFIESKTGKGMNIFILDEPFTGLGTVEIEMALEVLKNSNLNKKIIIVDHNPEIRQMVQSRLIVARDGATSKVS